MRLCRVVGSATVHASPTSSMLSTTGMKGLDPFCGSGSTLIATEKAWRQVRLVELDPKYVDVIVQRWQGWTGQAATLEGDGRTFEELVAERSAPAVAGATSKPLTLASSIA